MGSFSPLNSGGPRVGTNLKVHCLHSAPVTTETARIYGFIVSTKLRWPLSPHKYLGSLSPLRSCGPTVRANVWDHCLHTTPVAHKSAQICAPGHLNKYVGSLLPLGVGDPSVGTNLWVHCLLSTRWPLSLHQPSGSLSPLIFGPSRRYAPQKVFTKYARNIMVAGHLTSQHVLIH